MSRPLLLADHLAIATRRRRIGPFSLEVVPGELVALVGANGSGKTTCLRLALGLERATSGRVEVCGRLVSPERAPTGVGLVSEAEGARPWQAGRAALHGWADLVGVDRGRADELLEQVGLAEAAGWPVRTYSRGMRQRWAVARALLARPALLVLDEPTVALDADATGWLARLLDEHVADGGGAVVATHDHGWLAGLAARTAVVEGGRLDGC